MSAHAGDNVTRFYGAAIGHVLAGRNQANNVDRRLQLCQCTKHAQNAGRTAHVKLHFVHLRSRLDGDAARVKRDALAHQHEGCQSLGRATVVQYDEAQWLVRAFGHRHERPHAKLVDLIGSQHLAFDLGQLRQRLCRLGKQHRSRIIGGAIRPFFGKFHAQHGGDRAIERGLDL